MLYQNFVTAAQGDVEFGMFIEVFEPDFTALLTTDHSDLGNFGGNGNPARARQHRGERVGRSIG